MDEYTMTEQAYKNGFEAGKAAALNELTAEIHANAKAHGWWDEPRSFGEIVALCHAELSEALEEYRDGRPMMYYNCASEQDCHANCCGVCGEAEPVKRFGKVSTALIAPLCVECDRKPEGIATEMADCIIRILDWCGQMGVDIGEVIRIKHEYNKTRPYRHGGKVI